MKTAIVYRSFLGTTRKYAEWLHEDVESDLLKPRNASEKKLAGYDVVVLCSGTYAGWISIRGFLGKRWNVLRDKKVILLVVGLAPPENPESTQAYLKIPEDIRNGITFFKVSGTVGSSNQAQVKKENLAPVVDYIRGLDA